MDAERDGRDAMTARRTTTTKKKTLSAGARKAKIAKTEDTAIEECKQLLLQKENVRFEFSTPEGDELVAYLPPADVALIKLEQADHTVRLLKAGRPT